MALSQNGLLAEGSGVYRVSSPGLHPRTRQTLPAKDVSRASEATKTSVAGRGRGNMRPEESQRRD